MSKPKEPVYVARELEVELTANEWIERSRALGEAEKRCRDLVVKKRSFGAQLKAEIDEADARLRALAEAVRTKKEIRGVECFEDEDVAHFAMVLRRRDNGAELESRPMTTAEIGKIRQPELPLDKKAAAEKRGLSSVPPATSTLSPGDEYCVKLNVKDKGPFYAEEAEQAAAIAALVRLMRAPDVRATDGELWLAKDGHINHPESRKLGVIHLEKDDAVEPRFAPHVAVASPAAFSAAAPKPETPAPEKDAFPKAKKDKKKVNGKEPAAADDEVPWSAK